MTNNTTRTNRRATTDGRPVLANRIFDVRVLSDGFGIRRTAPLYYRRNTHWGLFTGLAANLASFADAARDAYYTERCECGANPAWHLGHTQQCANRHLNEKTARISREIEAARES